MSSFDCSDHLVVPESCRTSSKSRQSARVSIPPTLLNISDQDWPNQLLVQPTAIVYNEERFEELSYRSIEEIRPLNPKECLWIDVVGVSDERETVSRGS